MPQLGAALSATRSKSGDAPPTSHLNAGFDASWEIDLFGGLRRTRETLQITDWRAKAGLVTSMEIEQVRGGRTPHKKGDAGASPFSFQPKTPTSHSPRSTGARH